jgi:hypothetical protein
MDSIEVLNLFSVNSVKGMVIVIADGCSGASWRVLVS